LAALGKFGARHLCNSRECQEKILYIFPWRGYIEYTARKKELLPKDKEKKVNAATWIVAVSGLIAALAALISAIATLIMAMK
jgi:fatty acid desaturase